MTKRKQPEAKLITRRLTLRAKNQLTIPAKILEQVGWGPGQLLEAKYSPEADIIILRPVVGVPRPSAPHPILKARS